MRVFITYKNGKTESFHAVLNVENSVDGWNRISGLIIETKSGIHRRGFRDFPNIAKFSILK